MVPMSGIFLHKYTYTSILVFVRNSGYKRNHATREPSRSTEFLLEGGQISSLISERNCIDEMCFFLFLFIFNGEAKQIQDARVY